MKNFTATEDPFLALLLALPVKSCTTTQNFFILLCLCSFTQKGQVITLSLLWDPWIKSANRIKRKDKQMNIYPGVITVYLKASF